MSDFKVGDKVYFIKGDLSELVAPYRLRIDWDYIKCLHESSGESNIVIFENTKGTYLSDCIFLAKEELIEAFKKRLDEL